MAARPEAVRVAIGGSVAGGALALLAGLGLVEGGAYVRWALTPAAVVAGALPRIGSHALRIVVAFLLSFALAFASRHLVEQPCQRRLAGRRRAGAASTAGRADAGA